MKTLKDIRGVEIEVGDTIAFAKSNTYHSTQMEIGEVIEVDYHHNTVLVGKGVEINTVLNEVLVLPCHYKEW